MLGGKWICGDVSGFLIGHVNFLMPLRQPTDGIENLIGYMLGAQGNF